MSKFRTLSLPGNVPPPPPIPGAPPAPSAISPEAADLLERFPLPWCVGPYGDVWVAADVEVFDEEQGATTEKIHGANGTFWRATCAKPRLVMENPAAPGMAALIVAAVNANC